MTTDVANAHDETEENTTTYAEGMKRVNEIVQRLQECDDVDVAVEMATKANAILEWCERRVQHAQGMVQELSRER